MNRDFEGIDYQKIGGGVTAPLELSREERMKSLPNNAESFTPEKDVIEVDKETGVEIQVAVKGVPMPLVEARKLGLIKEAKSETPAENKAVKGGAENKSKGGDK